MSYLDAILKRKHREVAARQLLPSSGNRSSRSFRAALSAAGGPLRIIAEVKKRSPSKGELAAQLDVVAQARRYVEGGAAAISVLTDNEGFGGSFEDLREVRAAVDVPLLQKDFVVHPKQLDEAVELGADAVLLIVAALGDQLKSLLQRARELGLDAVVEVHHERELDSALEAGASLVGINHRNLDTFEVDLAVSARLIPRIPPGVIVICESGVRGPAEAAQLRTVGATNLLVGEALVISADPAGLLRQLRGLP